MPSMPTSTSSMFEILLKSVCKIIETFLKIDKEKLCCRSFEQCKDVVTKFESLKVDFSKRITAGTKELS
jgi:hypothetical protein